MALLERNQDDYVIHNLEEDGSSDEELGHVDEVEETFDPVCSLCDNGGVLLCCEGRCMRSFHSGEEGEAESDCVTLGLTRDEIQAMRSFKCPNCEYKIHQCFSCGELGSSDEQLGAQVFQCDKATCGYFYHPNCVARRLHRHNEDAATELKERIRAGESFECPLHVCYVCRQPEDVADPNLQMAVCRRCPKAYHRRCLPRRIAFEDNEGRVQRAWEGLYVNRILIYCMRHEIDEFLGTPLRDHIKFPGDGYGSESAIVVDISSGAPECSMDESSISRDMSSLNMEIAPPKTMLAEKLEDDQ